MTGITGGLNKIYPGNHFKKKINENGKIIVFS